MDRRTSAYGGALALALALATAGCSYKLDSMMSKDKGDETGSLSLASPRAPSGDAGAALQESDLALTKAAAAEALTREGQGVSIPWENPHTGARGSVTPIASAYTQDGVVCRDFLASYVRQQVEAWMQGEACRAERGRWEVRHIKALQRP
jgi:surface antigen